MPQRCPRAGLRKSVRDGDGDKLCVSSCHAGGLLETFAIPDLVGPEVLRDLDDESLTLLLRDHLVPRSDDVDARRRWEQLWTLLRADAALADRAFDVLEGLLDTSETAIAAGELDEQHLRRAEKFRRFCEDAWRRLQVDDDKPLGWAGRAASGFNPPARRVIEQLVDAIVDHRREVAKSAASDADKRLWKILIAVDLDPERFRRRS